MKITGTMTAEQLAAAILLSLATLGAAQALQPVAVHASNQCFASGGGYCTDSGCSLRGGFCGPYTTGCPCQIS